MGKKFILLLAIGSTSQFTGAGIISVLLSYVQSLYVLGNKSVEINLLNFFGVFFSGLLLGFVIRKYHGFRLGCSIPLISFLIVIAISKTKYVEYILALSLVLFFISGLEQPNNNVYFNNLIGDVKRKLLFFSRYQLASQGAIVCAPIIAILLLKNFQYETTFYIFSAGYLIVSLQWITLKLLGQDISTPTERNTGFNGFKILVANKSIRNLNISRVFIGFIYAGIGVVIPLFCTHISTNNSQFITLQNVTQITINTGFILTGLTLSQQLKHKAYLIQNLVTLSPFITILGLFLLILSDTSLLGLCALGFLFGVGQFIFRVTGAIIGQVLTPAEHLGEVILAGDSVVRGLTALYLLLIIKSYSSSYYLGNMLLLSFCIIGAIFAVIFLKYPIEKYKLKINQ